MGAHTASWARRMPALHRGDAAVALAVVLFAVLAVELHGSVAGLAGMATGLRDTGTSIQRSGRATAAELRQSVGRAADAAEGVPIVGSQIGGAVRDTAQRSAAAVQRETAVDGARLADAGRQGEQDAHRTANLIGWLAFLAPTIVLLAVWLPRRVPEWRAERLGSRPS